MMRMHVKPVLIALILFLSSISIIDLVSQKSDPSIEITSVESFTSETDNGYGGSENDRYVNDGVVMKRRSATPGDIEKLREMVGTSVKGVDYNPKFDGHATGLRPPSRDEWSRIRDDIRIVDDISSLTRGPLGASVDHSTSKYFPPIGNQDGEGSCVTWAVGYYTKTYQEAKEHDWDLSGASWEGGYYGNPSIAYQDRIMSPDFMYHQINDGLDEGSYYSSAMDLCYRIGMCTWDKMPYDPGDHTTWPSEAAWRQAPWYRTAQGYNYLYTYPPYNPTGVEDLKTWLDADNLAVISVDAGQYNTKLDGNDLWDNDSYVGGSTNHANTIIGYDDDFGPYTEDGEQRSGAFLAANSWGTGWGGDHNSDGMYWISYECMKWQVAYTFLFSDLIDYEPELLGVFEMTHTKRGECNISMGIGDPSHPVNVKRFDDWYNDWDGGNSPFPNNIMVLDMTEFIDDVDEVNGSELFIKVNDTESITVGTIDSFSVEYYSDYLNGTLYMKVNSTDPSVNTIQGDTVNASLLLVDSIKPVADPGQDQSVENDATVQFNGSGSYDLSGIKNLTWNFTYSGAPQFLYGNTPNFTFGDSGEYSVILNVTDPSGNWDRDKMNVTVNGKPVFGDVSNGPLTTGEAAWFSANVTDDDGINAVKLVYTVNGNVHENVSVNNNTDDDWLVIIPVPSCATTFEYHFYAEDAGGDWAGSGDHTPVVSDNDKPVFGNVGGGALTTGDPAWFSANITDNVAIDSVSFVYTVNGNIHENVSVSNKTDDDWVITVSIPARTTSFEYHYYAVDAGENRVNSGNQTPAVTDNDAPAFIDVSNGQLSPGEAAWFAANISDNLGVNSVRFVYTVNGNVHENVSVSNNTGSTWSVTIAVPSDASSFEYFFWADDGSTNEGRSANQTPQVTDSIKPTFVDVSNGALTTGEPVWFAANITDNAVVNAVSFIYSVNGNIHENVSVNNNTGSKWTLTINVPSYAVSFEYFFWADDPAGNERRSANETPGVIDNDRPDLIDVSNAHLTTGNPAWFAANITDNIGVDTVKFVYTVDDQVKGTMEGNVTVSNNTGTTWTVTIAISDDANTFEYHFMATDAAGNRRRSANETPGIDDETRPVFGDVSGAQLSTGDPAWFSANITDNKAMGAVWFAYTVNGAIHENISVINNTDDDWIITIIVPSYATAFEYHFYAEDTSNNRERSGNLTPPVADNDAPVFADVSSGPVNTGDPAWFAANVTDNIGVNSVKFVYTVNGNIHENVSVNNNTGSTWTVTIMVSADASDFEYFFWADDGAGNEKRSANRTPPVTDDDRPAFVDVSNGALTTGEAAWFAANITDNIGVNSVRFVYTMDDPVRGRSYANVSVLNNTGTAWTVTITVFADASGFEYFFWADDAAGNERKSGNRTPTVIDRSKPLFADVTNGVLTTGDPAWFAANVTDNIGVNSVRFVYSVNGNIHENVSVVNQTGSTWTVTIAIPSHATSFEYFFWADDAAANEKRSSNQTPGISDNDKPTFVDVSNGPISTGDAAWFSANITDNIGINSVKFAYTVNGNIHGNVSVSNNTGITWTITITVPSSTTSFEYFFWVDDAAANERRSANVSPGVSDNDKTVFVDISACPLTTGDMAWFSTNITDNIGVNSVRLVYTVNGNVNENVSVFNNTGSIWWITIAIPSYATSFEYFFWADDASANENKSMDQTPVVTDNDEPVVVDTVAGTLTTGDPSWFAANVTDNIGINSVRFVYTVNGNMNGNVSVINNTGITWTITIIIPSDATIFEYFFRVDDAAGNERKSGNQTPAVTDNDDPVLDSDDSPDSGTTGDTFTFDVSVSDNVAVASANVTWSHGSLGGNVALVDDLDGTWSLVIVLDHSLADLSYGIQVNDTTGNHFRQSLRALAVTDNDLPVLNADNSPNSGTTGDTYTFDIVPTDNIDVASANVTWVHGILGANVALIDDLDGTWSLTITADHDRGDLTYNIQLNDSSGNIARSGRTFISISDNDAPDSGVAGISPYWNRQQKVVTAAASDNIDVQNVSIWFRYSADNVSWGDWVHFALDHSAPWSFSFTYPNGSGYYEFYSVANDTSGNIEQPPASGGGMSAFDATAPVPDGGQNRTVDQHILVMLDGGGSSDDLGIDNYTWTFDDGGGVSLYGATASFVFHNAGTFVITLNATDAAGNWALAPLTVTVNDVTPPSVDAGSNITVDQFEALMLDGTGSTDNVGIANYTWSFTDGVPKVLYGVEAQYAFVNASVYSVSLNVTDDAGNWNSTTITITVRDITPPRAEAGPNVTIDQHENILFSSTGSGDNVGIANYTWNFTCGGICNRLYGSSPLFTFHFVGNYTIMLRVTDFAGNRAEDNLTVNVRDITVPSALAGEDVIVDQHIPVFLNGSGSSDNVAVANYIWSFVENGTPVTLFGHQVERVFHHAGVFNITLLVTDAAGNSAEDRILVTVNDTTPPVALAGTNISLDQHGIAYLDASSSSDNVGIIEYTWNISLPNSSLVLTGMNTSYQFHIAGRFTVSLTVRDLRGNSANDTIWVTVADTTPPMAAAGWDLNVNQHELVYFDAGGSTDNSGISLYTWIIVRESDRRSASGDNEVARLYGANVSHVFHDSGIFVVTLVVTDSEGNNATDSLLVTVSDITSPVANAGADVFVGQDGRVVFNGSGCTDNSGRMNYTWTFQYNDEPVVLYGISPEFTFIEPGEYSVSLRITDPTGNAHNDRITIFVSDIAPPVITGPDVITIVQNEIFYPLEHHEVTDDVSVTIWTWIFIYNGTPRTLTHGPHLSAPPGFLFEIPGTYNVTLNAADAAGNWADASLVLEVIDVIPPIADAGADLEAELGGSIRFDGSGSSDNTAVVNYTWKFSHDGKDRVLYGSNPVFKFEKKGTYQITLAVADGDGNTHSDEFTVKVRGEAGGGGASGIEKLTGSTGFWLIGLIALVLVFVLIVFFLARRRKRDEKEKKIARPAVRSKPPVAVASGPVVETKRAAVGSSRRGRAGGSKKEKPRSGRREQSRRGATAAGRKGNRKDRGRTKGRGKGRRKGKVGGKERGKDGRRGAGRGRKKREEVVVEEGKERKEDPKGSEDRKWDQDEWEMRIKTFQQESQPEDVREPGKEMDIEEVLLSADWGDEETEEGDAGAVFECPECGAEVSSDSLECPVCGLEFEDEEADEEPEEEDPEEQNEEEKENEEEDEEFEEADFQEYWDDDDDAGGDSEGSEGSDEVREDEDAVEEEVGYPGHDDGSDGRERGAFAGSHEETDRDGGGDSGRYSGDAVDFVIDMDYEEFTDDDIEFEYECPECGSAVYDNDDSCPECGTELA